MRILVLHNYYQYPGGEDHVFEAETALLESRGHEVIRMIRHNREIAGMRPLAAFFQAVWNQDVVRELKRIIRERRPDVAHVHNVFSVLSPAVYRVLHDSGVPVVQTLHNYRLICPNARLSRDARPCTLCVRRALAWPALRYRCYQGRFSSSLGLMGVLFIHRVLKTWARKVDLFLTPSDYVRQQMVLGGFAKGHFRVKSHFTSDPGMSGGGGGGYALFIGRLEPEKGVIELLEAWRSLSGFPLRIVGDGPLRLEVESKLREPAWRHVTFLGWVPRQEVATQMASAEFLVIPSVWPESFGLTAIEAFSHGVPVVASAIGALSEIVRNDQTGLLVKPGDVEALRMASAWMIENPGRRQRMAQAARSEYQRRYSPDTAYEELMKVYEEARRNHELTIQAPT